MALTVAVPTMVVFRSSANVQVAAFHRAQEFHHSSFISGRTVRCAGMIVIQQGIVTALNNNSGHYKPRKEHVLNFVRLLRGNGVLSEKAAVEVHLGNQNALFSATRSQFWHASRSLDWSSRPALAAWMRQLMSSSPTKANPLAAPKPAAVPATGASAASNSCGKDLSSRDRANLPQTLCSQLWKLLGTCGSRTAISSRMVGS